MLIETYIIQTMHSYGTMSPFLDQLRKKFFIFFNSKYSLNNSRLLGNLELYKYELDECFYQKCLLTGSQKSH